MTATGEKPKVKIGLREYVKRKTPESAVSEVVKRSADSTTGDSTRDPQKQLSSSENGNQNGVVHCTICEEWIKRDEYQVWPMAQFISIYYSN